MTTENRRIILVLATSSGIIAASTLPAHAGRIRLGNHCEPSHRWPHPRDQPRSIAVSANIRRIILVLATSRGITSANISLGRGRTSGV